MGNFHCVSSNCATVHYREYLPPKIRWRYGSEPWQEILADDYSAQQVFKYDTTSNFNYTFTAKARCKTSSPPPDAAPNVPRNYVSGQIIEVTTIGLWSGGIYSVETVVSNNINLDILLTYLERTGGNLTIADCAPRTIQLIPHHNGKRLKTVEGSYSEPVVHNELFDIKFIPSPTSFPRNCINTIVNNCTFKVFKNGQTVYQEVRPTCPEVQKIPCQLSPIEKQIKIEKTPYLERIEVKNHALELKFLPPSNTAILESIPIPPECLSIYKTYVLVPPTFASGTYPGELTWAYEYIGQICSAPGCPSPEYQVICDCNNCDSCPSDTCPVECGGQICCYGKNGISVKSIQLNNYCGG